ncbi:MAG: ComF family protein [Burkholderiaceae bacterium]
MLRALARRLLPSRCVVCSLQDGAPEMSICTECEADFFAADGARCERCAIRVQDVGVLSQTCGRCLAEDPHFDATTTLADYVAPIDGMVMALKFTARLDLATFFGKLLARRVVERSDWREAIIVPVPLAFERLRQRGFNQSHQIARAFALAVRGRLANDRLVRTRHTPPQQSLALKDRRSNVRGAFAVEGDVRGRSMFIVDDVMTTGSTVLEVAETLRLVGAEDVRAWVCARVP